MEFFQMVFGIAALGILSEMVKAIVTRPRVALDDAVRKQLAEAASRLAANDLRLSEAETKVAELEEKLQFVEKLLANPERPAQLPSVNV